MGWGRNGKLNREVYVSQKQRKTVHHSAPRKATRPKKEIAVGHIGQMAPYAVWLKKKKKKEFYARIMAQNSRESLDLKGTRQMGIMDIPVKINVDK